MNVRLRPEAEEDLELAHGWYEQRKDDLGMEFIEEVNKLIERLRFAPESCAPVGKLAIRKAPVNRFPFVLYYRLRGDLIDVLAILHGSRHDRVWKARLAADEP